MLLCDLSVKYHRPDSKTFCTLSDFKKTIFRPQKIKLIPVNIETASFSAFLYVFMSLGLPGLKDKNYFFVALSKITLKRCQFIFRALQLQLTGTRIFAQFLVKYIIYRELKRLFLIVHVVSFTFMFMFIKTRKLVGTPTTLAEPSK